MPVYMSPFEESKQFGSLRISLTKGEHFEALNDAFLCFSYAYIFPRKTALFILDFSHHALAQSLKLSTMLVSVFS